MNDKFYQKSMLLIFTNITTGILGFLFSVILTRKIGAEGTGLFSLISPISNLLLSVLSGGLLLAVSKVISEYYAKMHFTNMHKSIKTTIIFNFIISVIVIMVVFLCSNAISKYIIKDLRILSALRFLLVSIIFMTVSNTYKGYFYGTKNVFIPAFIDVIEKFIRIIFLLILFKQLDTSSIETNITICYFVFFIGEVISFILLYIYYKIDKKAQHKTKEKVDDGLQLLYNVYRISFPLMFAELISASFHTIQTLILPRRLVIAGLTYPEALTLIGRFIGMSMQIVFFPIIIIFSISTLLIPDLASNVAKGDIYTVEKRITQVLRITFLLGLVVFVIGLSLGEKLGLLIFKEQNLGRYIHFFAFSAPLLYLSQVCRSILNGLGKQRVIFRYSALFSVLQILLLYTLVAIPSINIYGFGITFLITVFLSLLIYLKEIQKVVSIKL